MRCQCCNAILDSIFEIERQLCGTCQREIRKVWDKEDPQGKLAFLDYEEG